jgi:hypothetical protein
MNKVLTNALMVSVNYLSKTSNHNHKLCLLNYILWQFFVNQTPSKVDPIFKIIIHLWKA